MSRDERPKRKIEAGVFDGEIGPVLARELVAMPEAEWGTLRDRITDYRNGRPSGLLCSCAMCSAPVYIRVRKKNEVRYPLFSHYQDDGLWCPWHHESHENPDALRRDQYQGLQESHTHRLLCEQIARLAKLDERYISSAVDAYRPPTNDDFGRYPDVAVLLRGFPECIFEVQLSKTFQTEISARCTHYEREGAALIWVLYGLDPQRDELPQSFVDVIRRHRGNAFLLDRESVAASEEQKTIVLKCYLQRSDGTFDPPRLVRFEELTFPTDALPYLEDRISKAIIDRISEIRYPCFAYLKTIEGIKYGVENRTPEREKFLAVLREITPQLSSWGKTKVDEENAILRLIACVFSLVSVANGKPKIYGTKQPNVIAMLNTWLNGREELQRCAPIFRHLLKSTPLAHLANGTLGQHLDRAEAQMSGNLTLHGEPEWILLERLVPEVFDPRIREQLRYLEKLPAWAQNESH